MTVTDSLIEFIRKKCDVLDKAPFAEVVIKLEHGKPVHMELTTKHKP